MIEIAAPQFRLMLIWDRRVAQSELSRHRAVVRALFFRLGSSFF